MQVVHILGLGRVRQHGFRTVPSQRKHQQITHTSQQVFDESSRIESADHDFLDNAVQGFAVVIDYRIHGLTDQCLRREAEQGYSGIMGDNAFDRTNHQLVKHGQGISHGAATGAHRQFQHTGLGLDAFLVADRLQVGTHDFLRHQTERIVVGARTDGADHLVWFGGGEDEHHMFRRLFNDFKQRIEALLRDHVGLIENENLIAVARRGETSAFSQFSSIIHTVVRGRIDFDHVDGTRTAGGQVLAAFAFAAGVGSRPFGTVDATGQDTRGAGFAAASRP